MTTEQRSCKCGVEGAQGSIITQRDEPFSPEEVFTCYDCQEKHACDDCAREGYSNLVSRDGSCGYCIERDELSDPPPDGHNETDWHRDH